MPTVLNLFEIETEVSGEFYEIVDGLRVEKPPMGAFENVLATLLATWLNEFARPRRLGLAVTEALFLIDSTRSLSRRPDVAFVNFQRWSSDRIARENAWDVVPNLTVEIVSPTNLAEDIERKMLEYFAAGVELVWVIYPETERIYVYRSPSSVTPVDSSGELQGDSVLPGFRLPVSELFGAMSRPKMNGAE